MNCYWIDRERPRMVRDQHEDGCETEGCKGCAECHQRHCFVQWHGDRGDCQTHAESVCLSCLAKVREHLTEIVRLSGMPLLEEVLREGSVDTEAADLLGPAADPKQWRQRSDHGHIYEPDSRLGWHTHPFAVLGWFDMLVTEHLGHERTTKVTITRAANYLDRNLHFLAADVEFDFVDLANALADCRTHLERVLHDGEQVETGAPCMTCKKPLLRVYGGDELPWAHRDGSKPRTNEDVWACAKCREWRSEKDYGLNVAEAHRENADWLTAAEIEFLCDLKPATLRKRVERGEVTSRRDSGRTVYRVEQIPEVVETRHREAS